MANENFTSVDVPNTVVPTSDGILSYIYKGVKFAIPNLGTNTESCNLALVRLFETIGQHLQAFSLRRDCFVPQPPSIGAVKHFHNMFVRLNTLVDVGTKLPGQERLEAQHVTHERRKFKLYPCRYFDVKNSYCARWIELALFGLTNMVQLSENTWENDWTPNTGIEIKKMFREAYRLMCVELFNVPIEDAAKIFDDKTPYYLTPEKIAAYNPQIPEIEWIRFPALGSFFTESELRPIVTPQIEQAEGLQENVADTDQRNLEKAAQAGPQIVT